MLLSDVASSGNLKGQWKGPKVAKARVRFQSSSMTRERLRTDLAGKKRQTGYFFYLPDYCRVLVHHNFLLPKILKTVLFQSRNF